MSRLEELKTRIKEALPGLECVIGWQKGYDPLHNTPLFMRTDADVDKLEWGPLNVHNPAVYLPTFTGKKVGVVVKGCDSRSVVELLQENLINRDNVVIFGMPCTGVIDLSKVKARLAGAGVSAGTVTAVTDDGKTVSVTAGGQTTAMPLAEVRADKCGRCQFPNAVLADAYVGDPIAPAAPAAAADADLAALDAMSVPERMAFWRYHMERCIRCYACRNACPMCVCRDHCIAQSREPHWLTQDDTATEKLMFQVVHALHLAGRCTECGECQRACPMDIPVLALKKHLNRTIRDLFDYQAGVDPQAIPPLLQFKLEEDNIKERSW
ncbi:4Fe-4S dicluster domain-containing protein [Solidesulfovibrio sp.]|uniref:4Fe-4S dicluster domain-containing protein n=1 Tax=Solidesulfovibrio sp. TaxID=2910990 RepID=UPI002610680B|nr:4Fe-4S dicluster domain-containing protein [Solidesulfovibrio sp.]